MSEIDPTSGNNKIGRYILKSVLGRGTSGVVYLALDPQTGKDVSVKVHRASPEIHGIWQSLSREFWAMASNLRHDCIPAVLDLGLHENQPYQVLEFITGSSLEALFDAGEFMKSDSSISALFGGIADAIDLLHSQNLIHADLKPANFILSSQKHLYILDAGTSILRECHSRITGTQEDNTIIGTPAYMAPEQITNRDTHTGSDLFSFATLVFQALTGQLPFDGSSYNTISNNIVRTAEKSASAINKELNSDTDIVFSRALNKDKSARFKSAQEFIVALAQTQKPAKHNNIRELAPTTTIKASIEISTEKTVSRKTPENLTSSRRPLVINEKYRSLPAVSSRSFMLIGCMFLIGLAIVLLLALYPRRTALVLEQDPNLAAVTQQIQNSQQELQVAENKVSAEPPDLEMPPDMSLNMKIRQLIQDIISSNPDDQNLSSLLETLQKLPEVTEDPGFLRLFNHPAFLVKIAAIKTVIESKKSNFLPQLRLCLKDNDPIVRGFAAKALGILGQESDLQLLTGAMTAEKQPEVKQAMNNALKRLQSQ